MKKKSSRKPPRRRSGILPLYSRFGREQNYPLQVEKVNGSPLNFTTFDQVGSRASSGFPLSSIKIGYLSRTPPLLLRLSTECDKRTPEDRLSPFQYQNRILEVSVQANMDINKSFGRLSMERNSDRARIGRTLFQLVGHALQIRLRVLKVRHRRHLARSTGTKLIDAHGARGWAPRLGTFFHFIFPAVKFS